jgi:hypothetical protein
MRYVLLGTITFLVFPFFYAMEQQPHKQEHRQNMPWLRRVVAYGKEATVFCISTGLPWLAGGSVANNTTHIPETPCIFNETKMYDPAAEQKVLIGVAAMVGLSFAVGLGSCIVKYCGNEKKDDDISTRPFLQPTKRKIKEKQHRIDKTDIPDIEAGYGMEESSHNDLSLSGTDTLEHYKDQVGN